MVRPVLLIEDDEDDAALALEAAHRAGVSREMVVKRDGEEALAYLAGLSTDALPELILLDLMLPKLHGLQVLERLRAEPRSRVIPVVIFTSSKQPEDVRRAYQLCANGYVVKPVDFNDFEAAVAQLVAYWLARNVGPFV